MTAAPASPGRPPGRRRGRPAAGPGGGPSTRERILTAARAEFAERGFEAVSVRGIARAAGVDPALVHHYFGAKEQVFQAAVETAFAPAFAGVPEQLTAAGLDGAGERLTRFVFGLWEHAVTREPLLAIVRSAMTNETAASIFRGILGRQVMSRFTEVVEGPDAELRVQTAIAQLIGTAMLRYMIKLEPIASADAEDLIARLAPVVQHHLDGTGLR